MNRAMTMYSRLCIFSNKKIGKTNGELTNEAQIKHLITQGFTQDLSEQYQRLLSVRSNLSHRHGVQSILILNQLFLVIRYWIYALLRKHQISLTQNETEPEDHIGLMLLLAAYLAESKPELLPEYLSKHLLIWAEHYFDLVAQQTDFPFYQGLALLARQTLKDWQQQLAIIVPQVSFYR